MRRESRLIGLVLPLVACVPLVLGAAALAAAQSADALRGQPLTFHLEDFSLPAGGHIQGIQCVYDAASRRHFVFLSHDSLTVAYLLVVEFPANLTRHGRAVALHTFPSDVRQPPLRHAGGIQLCEQVLAVGVEDNQHKTRSQIQFWNVADPRAPRQLAHLTIARAGPPEDQTAGAVGLIRHRDGHLVAVANWDSRAIDFYASNNRPLDDPACRFLPWKRWRASAADTTNWQPDAGTAAYQAINFEADSRGGVRLLGFATLPSGANVIDRFHVDLEQPPERLLRKQSRQSVELSAGNQFRQAGGLWHDGTHAVFLAAPRNLAPRTTLNVVR